MSLPDHYRIREYDQAIELLDDMRKKVESGEIMSLLIMAERTDGCMEGACTASQQVFSMAGYMISWAMRRMGFVENKESFTKE